MTAHDPLPAGGTTILTDLLARRDVRSGDGNRRALFTDFDQLIDATIEIPLSLAFLSEAVTVVERRTPVALRKIALRNWKLFERAEVLLPDVTDEKPIILLGGANGYGKSSLLESVLFGLFGRRAASELDHLFRLGGNKGTRKPSYRAVLESAFTRSERARREGFASVELGFDCDGGGLVLQRKWYFDDQGAFIERDEELIVWVGEDGDLLDIPEGVDAESWCQSEIERRVVSAGLAPFFLFDGEQVDRLADANLGDQLRFGIEKILGLDALTALGVDLRDYARDRSRDLKGASERDETLRIQAHELQLAAAHAADHLAAIDAELAPLKAERDSLVAFLSIPTGDSHAELQELLEAERKETLECGRLHAAIVDAAAFDIPLAMIGTGLMGRLAQSLSDDGAVHGSGAIGSDDDLSLLIERIAGLRGEMEQEFSDVLRKAWAGGLGSAGAATVRHPFLDRAQHREVESVSRSISGGRQRVRDMLAELAARRERVRELSDEIERRRKQDERRTEARETLGQLSIRLEALQEKYEQAAQILETRHADLQPIAARLEDALLSSREAAPRLHRADRARELAAFADRTVAKIAPLYFESFAAAVTEAYQSLSHKSDVAGIEIASDGAVIIRDGRGRDISDLRRSAGESQIFAMALIAAVGKLAGPSLPLIVDTPFGRLDTQHRASALAAFAARPGQTILLVQPEEFGAQQYSQIGDRIAGAFEIAYRQGDDGSIGTSVLRPEELAA
jgi:DNA sulfur modification protein DndD